MLFKMPLFIIINVCTLTVSMLRTTDVHSAIICPLKYFNQLQKSNSLHLSCINKLHQKHGKVHLINLLS